MNKIKQFWTKITTLALTTIFCLHANSYADVVSEVSGGGDIQSSKLRSRYF